MIREANYYAQLAAGLARWVREPVLADPDAVIREMVLRREANFLELTRKAIFAHPANPFNALLRHAGCEHGDLVRMVHSRGLEDTLRALSHSGVYMTHDEFKGHVPLQRGPLRIEVDSTDLANPLYKPTLETSSSGSRSRGTVTRRSLEYQVYREAQEHVFLSRHGLGEREQVVTSSVLPATGGVRRLVTHARRGRPVTAWFAMDADRHYRALTRMALLELRLLGCAVPFPRYLPPDDFLPVARWIAKRKAAGASSLVTGTVSPAVRIAAAAMEAGLDISGTRFVVGGEALTPSKEAIIQRAGAEVHARYTISEFGQVGFGCRSMKGNCVHICRDSLAVIHRRRLAPLSEVEVDSLLFTTLLPFAPTVAINLEMDDAGTLGEATCGCDLSTMGLGQQVDGIFSYGKLTGQGTSLMAGDMLGILERALPQRFGGVPSDYQLVESESSGQTEIELRVNPRLGLSSEDEVKRFFLSHLNRIWGGSTTNRLWTQSGSLRVVFAAPYVTGGRKVQALHLLGAAKGKR